MDGALAPSRSRNFQRLRNHHLAGESLVVVRGFVDETLIVGNDGSRRPQHARKVEGKLQGVGVRHRLDRIADQETARDKRGGDTHSTAA